MQRNRSKKIVVCAFVMLQACAQPESDTQTLDPSENLDKFYEQDTTGEECIWGSDYGCAELSLSGNLVAGRADFGNLRVSCSKASEGSFVRIENGQGEEVSLGVSLLLWADELKEGSFLCQGIDFRKQNTDTPSGCELLVQLHSVDLMATSNQACVVKLERKQEVLNGALQCRNLESESNYLGIETGSRFECQGNF